MKLVLPAAALAQGPIQFPVAFLRFIGVAETLGALGLVLPGIFRVHTYLTPLAAAGLVTIMSGATTVTAMSGPLVTAMVPRVAGALAAAVCVGRGGLQLRFGRRDDALSYNT